MTTAPATLTLDTVTEGQALPDLSYDVTATTVVLGALASRDWRPMHHDHDFAVNRNGTRDIFLNTPNQAAWFERYITDWTGPRGRLGRMKFRMKDSVFPGDTMTLSATVTDIQVDDAGCGWVALDVQLRVGDRVCTECEARVAVPVDPDDNPWRRRADEWRP
jgi:acyl dehydratase